MRELLVSTAFVLFLSAPWLAGLAGFEAQAVENRRLATRPEWKLASWLDAEAYAGLGSWLKDALPLRAEAIALDSWIDYRVLGDSPTRRVLIGRDGELFLDIELSSACAQDAVLDVEALSRLGGELKRDRIDLFLMLSPNKSFLYPERVPEAGTALAACGKRARDELRTRFERALPFTPVELWGAFEAEARSGRRLFPQRGRHWDAYGAMLQARGLVEAIQPGLWDESAVVETGSVARAAELPRRFMNLEIEQTQALLGVERPGVAVVREEFRLAPASRQPSARSSARSSGPGLIPGRTLVVHDSFMERSIGPFSAYAESAVFVHWTQLVQHTEAVARLLQGAERLVLQLVEDRAGVELGRHVGAILQVQQQHQALRARGAKLRRLPGNSPGG